jgi:hypothetical protein
MEDQPARTRLVWMEDQPALQARLSTSLVPAQVTPSRHHR